MNVGSFLSFRRQIHYNHWIGSSQNVSTPAAIFRAFRDDWHSTTGPPAPVLPDRSVCYFRYFRLSKGGKLQQKQVIASKVGK